MALGSANCRLPLEWLKTYLFWLDNLMNKIFEPDRVLLFSRYFGPSMKTNPWSLNWTGFM